LSICELGIHTTIVREAARNLRDNPANVWLAIRSR
jgi:hypothetical protein